MRQQSGPQTSSAENKIRIVLEGLRGEDATRSRSSTGHRPRLLSDNGPRYVASDLGQWLEKYEIDPVHGAPGHP